MMSKKIKNILLKKNKNIINQDPIEVEDFKILESLVFGKSKLKDIIDTNAYLNKFIFP